MSAANGVRREGQATVEAALAFPVVLLAILLVVHVGIVVRDVIALWGAAREGARAAAITADDAEVVRAVRAAAASLDPDAIEVSVEPPTEERRRGTHATVTLRYVERLRMPFVGRFVDTDLPLRAAVVMRLERSHPDAAPAPSPTPTPTASSSPDADPSTSGAEP